MKVLITGGGGMLGIGVVQKAVERGFFVRILTRNSLAITSDNNKKEYCIGDLLEQDSLNAAAKGIDAIVHLAGITHTNRQELYYDINTQGTKNLLKAAKNNLVKRFIFISTRTAGADAGAYAHSKFLAEEEVVKSGLSWLILRPAEIYGGDKSEAIQKLFIFIKKGRPIPVIGDGLYRLSPVHKDDVVNAILSVLERTHLEKKMYILAGPKDFTYIEIIDRMSKIIGKKARKIFFPVFLAKALVYLFSFFPVHFFVRDQIPRLLSKKSADISLAVKDFGYHPRTFQEGIKSL